jgi:hypothetical protein
MDDDRITPFPRNRAPRLARVRANIDMATLRRNALRIENELRLQAQMAQERARSRNGSAT